MVDSSAGTRSGSRPCPPWRGVDSATRREVACAFASRRTCNLSEITTGSKGCASQPQMLAEASETTGKIQGGGRRFDDGFTIRNGGAGFAGVFADFSGNRHRIARRSVRPSARRGAGSEWKRHYGPAGGPFVGETSSQPSSCKASQAHFMSISLWRMNPFGRSFSNDSGVSRKRTTNIPETFQAIRG